MTAFSSSERSLTISHSSSKDLKAKRKPPAVKKPLPPRQASGAFSSTSTRAPCSWADRAAHIPALPPPTTITSYRSLIASFQSEGASTAPSEASPGIGIAPAKPAPEQTAVNTIRFC